MFSKKEGKKARDSEAFMPTARSLKWMMVHKGLARWRYSHSIWMPFFIGREEWELKDCIALFFLVFLLFTENLPISRECLIDSYHIFNKEICNEARLMVYAVVSGLG